MRSKGALLFSQTGATQLELSMFLGLSEGMVAMLQSGQRKPALSNRKKIFKRYPKISIESWDEEPEANRTPTPPLEHAPKDANARASDLEHLVDEIAGRLRTASADMSIAEQARAARAIAAAVGEVRRLKGEDMSEMQATRHPKVRELIDAILDVLEEHPEANADVRAALEDLERRSA